MKHAFLILAHKNPNHLLDLVEHLNSSDSYFYIHINKDYRPLFSKIENVLYSNKKNIYIEEDCLQVNWGDRSWLDAILKLIKVALNNKQISYIHILSGQDFPIKPINHIQNFFETNKGKEFIDVITLPHPNIKSGALDRYYFYNLYNLFNGKKKTGIFIIKGFLLIQKILGIKRNFSNEIFQPTHLGTPFWSLSYECVSYIHNYYKEHLHFYDRLKYTFAPEETFFASIIMNSPFKNNVANVNLRFVDWNLRNGNCPANLDISDLNKIQKSDCLFARKFEYPVSQELFKLIKQEILEKSE